MSRRRTPKLAPPAIQTMDLLGLGKDGCLYLWQAGAQVQPIDRFPLGYGGIEGGHYVIEHKGHAITVHCNNLVRKGFVVVQYMCGGLPTRLCDYTEVQPHLLGKVIPDPQERAMLRE